MPNYLVESYTADSPATFDSRVMLGFAAAALAATLSVAFATQQGSSAVGGPPPEPTFVGIDLDGIQVFATSYELHGASKGGKREYTLRITRGLTSDQDAFSALQPGRTYESTRLTIFDSQGTPLLTFALVEPKVVSYSQFFDGSTHVMTQWAVFEGNSLTMS